MIDLSSLEFTLDAPRSRLLARLPHRSVAPPRCIYTHTSCFSLLSTSILRLVFILSAFYVSYGCILRHPAGSHIALKEHPLR